MGVGVAAPMSSNTSKLVADTSTAGTAEAPVEKKRNHDGRFCLCATRPPDAHYFPALQILKRKAVEAVRHQSLVNVPRSTVLARGREAMLHSVLAQAPRNA